MLIKKFPVPCRVDYVPSPYEPDEDGVQDVGYYNGKLSDGRAYRLECWITNFRKRRNTIIFS